MTVKEKWIVTGNKVKTQQVQTNQEKPGVVNAKVLFIRSDGLMLLQYGTVISTGLKLDMLPANTHVHYKDVEVVELSTQDMDLVKSMYGSEKAFFEEIGFEGFKLQA